MTRLRGGALLGVLLIISACGEGTPVSNAPEPSDGGSAAPSGSGAASEAPSGDITFWTAEDNQARVDAMKATIAKFTQASGINVETVAIAEDQLQSQITSAVAAGTLPDVFGALSLGFIHSLAADDIADPAAAQAVVDKLGRDTFSARSLELVTADGNLVAVPSDSWTQLLVYRKDLFEAQGLAAPDNFAAIQAAAKALNTGGKAGIVLSTGPDAFTQQTFEHFAVANDCQLTDDQGGVTLASQQCVDTFNFYTSLVNEGSVAGLQDADTTRAAYFAGNAAMIVWSSFLLDELAGLRNDAPPACPECQADPLFLAKNSGVVTALKGNGATEAQFGELVSFAISKDSNTAAAQAFVEYMMSEGYVEWLALAPEGKFPTRLGTAENPTEYADAWATLPAGVETKKPLGEVYPKDVVEEL
ncbi:MAG TPA: extracellular solute-binding protein, partial [Candidatus Limnocylindrales bacterium]|nr:extracellular solute-binding protein [Candidatus Limnocylindrales bacterium]